MDQKRFGVILGAFAQNNPNINLPLAKQQLLALI